MKWGISTQRDKKGLLDSRAMVWQIQIAKCKAQMAARLQEQSFIVLRATFGTCFVSGAICSCLDVQCALKETASIYTRWRGDGAPEKESRNPPS